MLKIQILQTKFKSLILGFGHLDYGLLHWFIQESDRQKMRLNINMLSGSLENR